MTVLEVIQRSAEFLARKGVESPRLQVELLLAHVLQMPRLKLYLNFERALTTDELDTTRELVRRRGNREPLQHLVGSVSFCGLELMVSRDVLIPRPETELLAERAWQFLQGIPSDAPLHALDFGTGSGCLGVTVARHVPASHFVAIDCSEAALNVARANAERHRVADRITFLRGDSLGAIDSSHRFHLIVSNPPYIPSEEIATLAPEVRDFDPRLALDGGADGLEIYRQLSLEAAARLEPGGRMMLEFGEGQAPALRDLFEKAGWTVQATVQDLTQRDRFLELSK